LLAAGEHLGLAGLCRIGDVRFTTESRSWCCKAAIPAEISSRPAATGTFSTLQQVSACASASLYTTLLSQILLLPRPFSLFEHAVRLLREESPEPVPCPPSSS